MDKNNIPDYEAKAKLLTEFGWISICNDCWIKSEWIGSGRDYYEMGLSTDWAHRSVLGEIKREKIYAEFDKIPIEPKKEYPSVVI